MYKVVLMNEFMHGAIWVYDEDGIPTYYELIDEDEELKRLNNQTEELFNACYEFDSHDQPCWFNYELYNQNKNQMLLLIKKIKDRLDIINDGSFIIEDLITSYFEKL